MGKSRRFRLSATLESSAQVHKELATTVRNRYLNHEIDKKTKQEKSLQNLKHLTQWFEGSRLTVQPKKLHAFLEFSFTKISKMIAQSSHHEDVKQELQARAILRMNHQLESIRRVLAGDFRPSNTGRDERLHTLLTQMKRELRSFLLYDGEPLVSLDIRSSQPYFFTALLSKKFYIMGERQIHGWKSLVSGLATSSQPLPSTSNTNTNIYSTIFPGASKLSKKQLFMKCVFPLISWSEGFYKDFSRRINGNEPTPAEVDRIKKKSMWLFFEPKGRKFHSSEFKDFTAFYPIEAGVIQGIHSVKPGLLPLLLQRLEARVLLYDITKTITSRLPAAPLFTIHDSILTTPKYASQVKEIMITELTTYIGVAPGIKEEHKTDKSEFASSIDEEGVIGTRTGVDSFAERTFKSIEDSYKKAERQARKRGEKPYSFAHVELGEPLLWEPPSNDGRTMFSPRHFNLERALRTLGFSEALEEYPSDES
ncbi:MAG: hypothetical protein ACRYG7_29530 [Janthinobacterium lividum]